MAQMTTLQSTMLMFKMFWRTGNAQWRIKMQDVMSNWLQALGEIQPPNTSWTCDFFFQSSSLFDQQIMQVMHLPDGKIGSVKTFLAYLDGLEQDFMRIQQEDEAAHKDHCMESGLAIELENMLAGGLNIDAGRPLNCYQLIIQQSDLFWSSLWSASLTKQKLKSTDITISVTEACLYQIALIQQLHVPLTGCCSAYSEHLIRSKYKQFQYFQILLNCMQDLYRSP